MIKKLFYICLFIFVLLEIVLVNILHLGHGYFEFEELPAFSSLLGLFGSILIIVIAKFILQPIVGRKEDYYD